MVSTPARRNALLAAALTSAALCAAATSNAGGPQDFQIPANERSMVRLVSGGPRGLGTVPHGLRVGAPAQVFHIPWQELGWIPWEGFKLWVVNDHGTPIVRPTGGTCLLVMDHTLLVQFEADGKTWNTVAEMLPDGEGNWTRHEKGSKGFEFYREQFEAKKLIPGKEGRIKPGRAGRIYGLGDHCCTQEANARIGRGSGPGVTARGANRIGYELWRSGLTDKIRDVWADFSDVLKRRGGWGAGAASGPGPGTAGVAAAAAPEGMNLTGFRAIGGVRIPYTPSVGGILMGVSFALHSSKQGVVPTAIGAGVGVALWEGGTRATVASVGYLAKQAFYYGFGEAAGIKAGTWAAGATSKAIPIIGEVLLAADIIFFLSNEYYGTNAGWGDVWNYWFRKLDKPTDVAGLPPPVDQGAYYD